MAGLFLDSCRILMFSWILSQLCRSKLAVDLSHDTYDTLGREVWRFREFSARLSVVHFNASSALCLSTRSAVYTGALRSISRTHGLHCGYTVRSPSSSLVPVPD